MSQETSWEERRDLPGDRLGVMDAVGMGWQLLKSDFWALWLVAFVMVLVTAGANAVGGWIPYVGPCISLVIAVFIQPPLGAGLFYAVGRRADGAPAKVGDLFAGFEQRYWPSVAAMLPLYGAWAFFVLVVVAIVLAVVIPAGVFSGKELSEEAAGFLGIVGLGIAIPLFLAVVIFQLFFLFALLTVWEHPESGWEAAKASMRLVKEHFWSCVGFALLFWLISLVAAIVGMLACCVGVFFTSAVVSVWSVASLIYLYRSWTGQPLVQPMATSAAGGEASGAEGPIPPSDIHPPPGA